MRDRHLLATDIRAALDRIPAFTEGMTYESFVADEKTMNALVFNFLVIGEAVKKLPHEVVQNYPKIPWRRMAGMRDGLIPACFSTDYEMVWKMVTVVLPEFRAVVMEIARTEE